MGCNVWGRMERSAAQRLALARQQQFRFDRPRPRELDKKLNGECWSQRGLRVSINWQFHHVAAMCLRKTRPSSRSLLNFNIQVWNLTRLASHLGVLGFIKTTHIVSRPDFKVQLIANILYHSAFRGQDSLESGDFTPYRVTINSILLPMGNTDPSGPLILDSEVRTADVLLLCVKTLSRWLFTARARFLASILFETHGGH
jgi:hypothetical protein